MGVASIVLDDGGSEDEAIAALLHDAAEDHGGRARLDDIRTRFGADVARIVEDCTDTWQTPPEPWTERKRRYAEHARSLKAASLRVSAADKVHNTYSILRELRATGERVWDRYEASPDDVLAYYQALVRAYEDAGGGRWSTSSNASCVVSNVRWAITRLRLQMPQHLTTMFDVPRRQLANAAETLAVPKRSNNGRRRRAGRLSNRRIMRQL